MNRFTVLVLSVSLGLIALVVIVKLHYTGKPPAALLPSECDSTLWSHVYERERLHVMAECVAVEGRVMSVRRVADGDLHIALDPDNPSVLNLVNVIHAHRTLVVESICEHIPEEQSARAACGNFHPPVSAPAVGDRVRITGAFVLDAENGWNEIHPVSRIEVLR